MALAYDGPFWASSSRAVPIALAGGAMGLINALGNLGGFAGPYVGGWLQDASGGSFMSAALVLAIALLVGGRIMITLRRQADKPTVARPVASARDTARRAPGGPRPSGPPQLTEVTSSGVPGARWCPWRSRVSCYAAWFLKLAGRLCRNCMNAAFMQFQRHGWDIHAVSPRGEVVLQGRKRFLRPMRRFRCQLAERHRAPATAGGVMS